LRPAVLDGMTRKGIALRNRPDCDGCVRISIGTQPEMERVLAVLKEIVAAQPVAQQVLR